MNKRDIEELLIEEITEILKLNGAYEEPLTRDIRPLEDLGGFESMNAFEVMVSISKKVGKDINVDSFGIQCNIANPSKLTIKEIAENLRKKLTS